MTTQRAAAPPTSYPVGSDETPLPSSTARLEKLIERQWRIYTDITDLVRFGDAKAGILLATDGAVAAVLLRALSDNKELSRGHPLVLVMAAMAGIALIASVTFCLICILPARRAKG